jgi:hypothetical protein
MEITFNTGFNENGNKILEKEDVKKKKNSNYVRDAEPDDFFIGFD